MLIDIIVAIRLVIVHVKKWLIVIPLRIIGSLLGLGAIVLCLTATLIDDIARYESFEQRAAMYNWGQHTATPGHVNMYDVIRQHLKKFKKILRKG